MDRRTFLSLAALSPVLANPTGDDEKILYNDIFVSAEQWDDFINARNRLRRVKKYVGFGNFNIISFNSALFYARNHSVIGAFTKNELEILDQLFYESPKKYGFYGKKTTFNITHNISSKSVKKIPRTGHYLYKGKALDDYIRVKKDIGDNIYLTSGVRGVVKQMSLYMDKIYKLKGNLTLASNSIAPPAYTYHAISDFDVGKKGFGYANFTAEFAKTKEFKQLMKLNYISMRYERNNKDGVRYEPWHVKVI